MNPLVSVLITAIVTTVIAVVIAKYVLNDSVEKHLAAIKASGEKEIASIEAFFSRKKATTPLTLAQIAANAVLAKAQADLAAANALIVPPETPGSSSSEVLAASKANAIAYATTELEQAQAAVNAANKAAGGS